MEEWEKDREEGREGKRREKEDKKRGGVRRSVGGEMEWEVKKKRNERRRRGKVEECKGKRKEMGEAGRGREEEESMSKTIHLKVALESKELLKGLQAEVHISISPLLPLYLQSCQSGG